ncbi:MAG: Cof-type HAD-IIB family hydrolase [Eubacteriales bacterium]|nr:Cof-type HAD-IIB family hydrolase [Eubacteriales bacterium]
MQIDAIVTDLDDTLLNGQSALSPYTLSVFARAKAQGVRIIPASGRAAYSMLPFVRKLETGMPYIACNGAQLVNADHTVSDTISFSPEAAREIIRYLRDKGFYVQCYLNEGFYYDEECQASSNYKRSSGMAGHAVGDLAAFVTFPTPKILCVHTPEEVARWLPEVQKVFPNACFSISKPYFLEAEPPNVSKGAALRRLANQLGLTPERTLVFGDSLNDLSMLEYAVHSVAMGNARDEVKQAARHVCSANTEDGVARFVEQHVLTSQGSDLP